MNRTNGPAANQMPGETSTSCQNKNGSCPRRDSWVNGQLTKAPIMTTSHATRYQRTRPRAKSVIDEDEPEHDEDLGKVFTARPGATGTRLNRPANPTL